jgi:hypothetical protein
MGMSIGSAVAVELEEGPLAGEEEEGDATGRVADVVGMRERKVDARRSEVLGWLVDVGEAIMLRSCAVIRSCGTVVEWSSVFSKFLLLSENQGCCFSLSLSRRQICPGDEL